MGICGMVVFIVLVVLALYAVLKFLKPAATDTEARQVGNTPVPMDDRKFIGTFIAPIYEDGLEEMDTAVESIRAGSDLYAQGAFVEAGEEFIAARESLDLATRKFREMFSLAEDEASSDLEKARLRLAECKRFRNAALDLEAACDAMIAGKATEAKTLEEGTRHLRKQADEWKKAD